MNDMLIFAKYRKRNSRELSQSHQGNKEYKRLIVHLVIEISSKIQNENNTLNLQCMD